jgi:O-antigen biosynthesis protein
VFARSALIKGLDLLRSRARRLPRWALVPLKRISKLGSQLQNKRYERWVREFDTLSVSDEHAIRLHIGRLKYRPLISVVMPAYDTSAWALKAAIKSVRHQLYDNLELCIADDASPGSHVQEILQQAAAEDHRVKWVRRSTNGHISAASNSALALAEGEFVALMDHDDLLPAHALYEVVVALNEQPGLDIIYSDEDQIDKAGRRQTPYFKTDWNRDLLLGHNVISHLGVYRRSLVEKVGRFRVGFEGSQDYDLALRCVDATSSDRIRHIPTVLYHWRRAYGVSSFSEAKLAECAAAARRAIKDHLKRRREHAEVEAHPDLPHSTRIARKLPSPPPVVSLIVPTRDRPNLLSVCARGLLHETDYPHLELLIVDHQSRSPEARAVLEGLRLDPRVRILPYTGEFNYSAMNNMAAAEARGSILGLINDDIEVTGQDWLSEMVSWAVLDEVGAVGAKLIYPNGRVQHGGLSLGLGGIANPFNYLLRRSAMGYFGRNLLTSEVSAVTGACLVLRKSVYQEAGGLDEVNLPVAFNDVDLCLKIRRLGYRNIWNAQALLYHHESASRGSDASAEKAARLKRESEYMLQTWENELSRDPFYNDNLSSEATKCFDVALPPRRKKPWLT